MAEQRHMQAENMELRRKGTWKPRTPMPPDDPLPDHIELASGNLGGLTLPAGLYKWSNTVAGIVTNNGNFDCDEDGDVEPNVIRNSGGVQIGTTATLRAGSLVEEPAAARGLG
jgi:hypothetical protein